MGMVFTLLVLYGINGSLSIHHSRTILEMENWMDNVAADVDSLQGEVDGLRRQLGMLEGLTARMNRTQSAVDRLREDTVNLNERADTLGERVTAISGNLATLQAQSQRVDTFFQRLQVLVNELFGRPQTTLMTPLPPATIPPASQ